MKEPGWKSIELREAYGKVAIDFIDRLHDANFLRLSFNQQDGIILKTMNRLSVTGLSFTKLYEIITTEKVVEFSNDLKKFDMFEADIMLIFMGIFAHLILEEFEFLKSLILMITKREIYGYDKKGKPKQIDGSETLGKILEKLEEIVPKNNIRDNLNLELRNALGHGRWWIENEKFIFEGKHPKRVHITYDIPELLIQAIKIKEFTESFYNIGFKRATEIKRLRIKAQPHS